MNKYLRPLRVNHYSSDADLTGPLRSAIDRKYGQVVGAARKHWEKHFAGKEPSDACVTVRISTPAIDARRPKFTRALGYGL